MPYYLVAMLILTGAAPEVYVTVKLNDLENCERVRDRLRSLPSRVGHHDGVVIGAWCCTLRQIKTYQG